MAYGFVDDDIASEFYDEFMALLERYRSRMAVPSDDELTEQILEGFDPKAPSMIRGVVMMVIEDKIDGDWSRSWHSWMPGTGMWTARGMAHDLFEYFTDL